MGWGKRVSLLAAVLLLLLLSLVSFVIFDYGKANLLVLVTMTRPKKTAYAVLVFVVGVVVVASPSRQRSRRAGIMSCFSPKLRDTQKTKDLSNSKAVAQTQK